jgi:hypothetical protein
MMRRPLNFSIILLALSLSAAASAQMPTAQAPAAAVAAADLKNGAIVKSSDGRTLGRIERVVAKDGAPVAVDVIVGSRLVHIPVATISKSEGGLVTSLTKAEAGKLG